MPKYMGRKAAEISSNYTLEKIGQFWHRKKRFSETHYVIADTINQYEDDIVNIPELPTYGQILSGAFFRGATAEEVAGVVHPDTGVWTTLWEVTCHFDSTIDADQADPGNVPDPTAKRPKRRWYSVKEELNLEKDVVTGEPVLTQAFEPFALPVTRRFSLLEIVRMEEYPFDPLRAHNFENTSNLETFYGAPPGSAYMESIESEEVTIERSVYQQTTYLILFKIEFEADGVTLKEDTVSIARPLHQGYQFIPTTGSTKPQMKLDANGQPIRINLRYDPNGSRTGGCPTCTGGTELPDSSPAEYMEINAVVKKSWAALNLEF